MHVHHVHTSLKDNHIHICFSLTTSRKCLLPAGSSLFWFCSYQVSKGFGEALWCCCRWLQNTPMPENSVTDSCMSIHCLVHTWGILVFILWLVGKAKSTGLTIFSQWSVQLPPVLLSDICIWRGDQTLSCIDWKWINVLRALWISIMQLLYSY